MRSRLCVCPLRNVKGCHMQTIDGNGAAASVAFPYQRGYRHLPVRYSSAMAEQADAGPAMGLKCLGRYAALLVGGEKCSRKAARSPPFTVRYKPVRFLRHLHHRGAAADDSNAV